MRDGAATAAVLALLTITCLQAEGRDTATQKLVSSYSRKEPLRSGVIGVLAVRGTSDTLACLNHRAKLVPASNVKLITTGVALHTLGGDFRFGTTLAYTGSIDSDGVLDGDLYIVGGGDPTTAGRTDCAASPKTTFAKWAKILSDNGIKSIKGRIVGDSRLVSRPSHSIEWQAEDLGYNYGSAPGGLNFFENTQLFSVTPATSPGQPPFILPRYPDTPWMEYSNSSRTGAPNTQNTLSYDCTEFGPYGEFLGNFPAGRSTYTLECANRFGAYTCAYYFFNYLNSNGIPAEGGFCDISPKGYLRTDLTFNDPRARAADSPVKLGTALSPRLAEIARDTNFESDNFYAEAIFNILYARGGNRASRDSSRVEMQRLLGKMGLTPGNDCHLIDGSGLARKNYVSASFFVRFLKKMMLSPAWEQYLASLPVPGSKSTLENRLSSAPDAIKSRIHMKSGSMNGVLCYSGYILPAEGSDSQTIVFSILTNNVSGPVRTVAAIIDDILISLAGEE